MTTSHVAVLRRTDGLTWPTAVFAVHVPALLALAPDQAELEVHAPSLPALSESVAALDAWAAAHGVSLRCLADDVSLGHSGERPYWRAGGAIEGECDVEV
jgi:hypothetical protein